MFFSEKPEPTTKMFNTLYRLDLLLDGKDMNIRISQWNPYKEKLYIKAKYPVDTPSLSKFGQYIKKDLINAGHTWVRDDTLDMFCLSFGWNKISHFEGCEKCNNFRFVPMMNFYTGCYVCNKSDKKAYTYFQAAEHTKSVPTG